MTALPVAPRREHVGLATLLLLLLTAIWGSTFFLIRDLVETVPPTDFLALRFTVAALLMVALFWRRLRALPRAKVLASLWIGALYAFAQILQTVGLAHTSASISGFITGLYVVLTPLLGALLLRQRLAPVVWVAVALATIGLAVLSVRGSLQLGAGELLTLCCAIVYACQILALGRHSTMRDATGMSAVQMLVIAMLCDLTALADGRLVLPATAGGWSSVLYMATAAGVLALWAQTWAQARMTATRAAIVMTLEPVFGALFAVLAGQEPFTWRMAVGGGCVVAAMLVTEVLPRRQRRRRARREGAPDSATADGAGGAGGRGRAGVAGGAEASAEPSGEQDPPAEMLHHEV